MKRLKIYLFSIIMMTACIVSAQTKKTLAVPPVAPIAPQPPQPPKPPVIKIDAFHNAPVQPVEPFFRKKVKLPIPPPPPVAPLAPPPPHPLWKFNLTKNVLNIEKSGSEMI